MRVGRHKYIFVIGGVMSGVGKGIATSSIGAILQGKGWNVNPIKVDPYLNVDAGTMNPTEHGEVFVLDSGMECDQDMGNYERFMDLKLRSEDYITSGMVYRYVIEKERALGYKGRCVEAIPHITGDIIRRIKRAASLNKSDISIIEIGGTVGDYQNILFIEAARVMKLESPKDVMFLLVSYLPIPSKIGEMKTKPTQNAVHTLNSYGVQPDVIIARSETPLDEKRKEKLATSCNVKIENIISAPDIENIYEVPLNFERDKLGETILKTFGLKSHAKKGWLAKWKGLVSRRKNLKKKVKIAIIGKYFDTGDFVLSDSYISVIEAIKYSAYALGAKPQIAWLNSKDFEKDPKTVRVLKNYDGVIVPGGFGATGVPGKILAIRYARENKIPYFGLCYGMQLAVIEFARNVAGLKRADTTEIDPKTPNPVIDFMPDQKKKVADGNYGGSMRLGAYPALLKKGTVAGSAYGEDRISERHRHRYEINPKYIKKLTDSGLIFSGISPDGKLMEIAELPKEKHPFFLGTQFHPEFQARPFKPHPLFTKFLEATLSKKGR